MSVKPFFKFLAALLPALLLAGCVTTEVEISLKPDGSGTLKYTQHFDRATEEMRQKIHEYNKKPNVSKSLTEESIREHYPEPHFHLVRFDDNEEALRKEVVLHFNDINALLIKRDKADLGLKALDFTVDGDTLVFSVKEEKIDQQWPEPFDKIPGQETITIINAKNGEKVSFSRELSSKTKPANWTGRLRFPRKFLFFGGHKIVRTPNLQIFHDYPVVEAADCQIASAQWKLSNFKQWNAFELKLNISLPEDNYSYLRWEKPVQLSGGFLPVNPETNPSMELSGGAEFKNGELEIKLPIPERPVETLTELKVRIQAIRAKSSELVRLGELKPNAEYKIKDLAIKTDDLKKDQIGYKATGPIDRIKSTWIKTKRGNLFELNQSSSSGFATSKTVGHWKFLPTEDCDLLLELYDEIEPCYIDIAVPDIDLSQRAWKKDEKSDEEFSNDWQPALKLAHLELFDVEIPPVEAAMFEDKKIYKAYFQGLENKQILPAIVEVVDYMIRHNPKNSHMRLQNDAMEELQKRSDYLEANQKQIADQILALYKCTSKNYIPSLIENLKLQDFSQPVAFKELKDGNMDFAKSWFFKKELSENEASFLAELISNSDNWVEQLELLRTLKYANAVPPDFAMQLFNNRQLSIHVRKEALEIILKNKATDPAFAKRVATDSTEDQAFIAATAAKFLLKQDLFSTETYLSCLQKPKLGWDAAQTLNEQMKNALRKGKTNPQIIQQWNEQIKPLIPIIEDLAKQLEEYKAKTARETLETIQQLNALNESP